MVWPWVLGAGMGMRQRHRSVGVRHRHRLYLAADRAAAKILGNQPAGPRPRGAPQLVAVGPRMGRSFGPIRDDSKPGIFRTLAMVGYLLAKKLACCLGLLGAVGLDADWDSSA